MQILVLGSAAGGGFPQWNCDCANCRRARSADPAALPRTQSSLAVSPNGTHWLLLNASPDLRQQILSTPQLHPNGGMRQSPIMAAVLTNGDVDHVAGLLSLRENQPLAVYATRRVLDVLGGNPIFNVLNPEVVVRHEMPLDGPVSVSAKDGTPLGMTVTAFSVPGKVPLYLEDQNAELGFGTRPGDAIGLEVAASDDRRFYYLPGCAAMPPELAARVKGAELVFFDGTLWRDDEMISTGVGRKTGKRMGHMSISGEHGTMAAFAPLGVTRKIFVHMNNTNPVLLADSPERAEAEAAGWEIAHDGMEIRL
jgi:pyrroloquinoline quinone biosynthesis protein B